MLRYLAILYGTMLLRVLFLYILLPGPFMIELLSCLLTFVVELFVLFSLQLKPLTMVEAVSEMFGAHLYLQETPLALLSNELVLSLVTQLIKVFFF